MHITFVYFFYLEILFVMPVASKRKFLFDSVRDLNSKACSGLVMNWSSFIVTAG